MNDASTGWKSRPLRVVPASPAADSQDEEIALGEIFNVLWRSKWLILAWVVTCIAVGLFYLSTTTPKYTATAQLIVETQQKNVVDLESVVTGMSTEDAEINSQVQIMRSRTLIGNVVASLDLATDPEFVPSLREPSLVASTVGRVRSTVRDLLGRTPPDIWEEQPATEIAIDTLIEKLKITVVPRTFVFQLSLETEHPRKSTAIVNAVAEAYIRDQIDAKLATIDDAATWLEGQVSELGQALKDAEVRIAEYRRDTELILSEEEVAASNHNLTLARGRLNSLFVEFGVQGPETDRDRQRLADLRRTVVELEQIVSKQYEDLLKLRQLEREGEAARAIYQHFLTRLNEIEVQRGKSDANIRILSRAIPRFDPTSPRGKVILGIAALIGLLTGVAYILVQKMMRERAFSDAETLQRAFGPPVIGTIPKAPTKDRKRLLDYAIGKPASKLMEAIRNLRTSLLFSRVGDDVTVLAMTSSVPKEGKTTSAVLLAMSAAALEKKVLLVECDLRLSTFGNYFDRPTERGLASMLSGELAPEDIVYNDPRFDVDVIFAERSDTNAADVFSSSAFEAFIQRARDAYDLVILDAPPVLPVPDARLIARHCDAVLYAVRADKTPRKAIENGLRLFRNVGIEVDGFALTQMSQTAGEYGGHSNYYNN